MNQHALAPIKWEIGQPLLPAHLTAQEDFLVADASLRTQAQGLPQYGLSQLIWDESLLKKGCLSVTHFRFTIPSGQRVVDYPDNTQLLSNHIELSELVEPVVYYFILDKNINQQADTQTRIASNGKTTKRYFKLILSHSQHLPEEFEYLLNNHIIHYQGCLAVFKRRALGFWQLTDDFIPPLIHLGTSPYLLDTLEQLKGQIKHYKENLRASYCSDPLPVKQYIGLSNCIKSVQNTLFILENLINLDNKQGELKLHPYQVYSQLYQLCTELELYQGDWPDEDIIAYRHEAIHLIFKQLLLRLQTYLANNNANGRSTQFSLKENIYSARLPDNTSRHDELYFIVKLRDMPVLNPYEIPQLSSPSQLNRLYEYSLKGLTLTEVSETTINYNFGQHVQCFQVQKNHESDSIYHEAAVAFYHQDAYKGYDFYIYTQNH